MLIMQMGIIKRRTTVGTHAGAYPTNHDVASGHTNSDAKKEKEDGRVCTRPCGIDRREDADCWLLDSPVSETNAKRIVYPSVPLYSTAASPALASARLFSDVRACVLSAKHHRIAAQDVS